MPKSKKAEIAKVIKENILPIDFNDEMQKSYIDYAISVITDRAIPDVRDGLKPVNRRILWAMKNLGLKSSGPYKKSARIVGETMGKFHPHGDASIYDAMVHMAQDWCYNHPMVDGHGNFGSIEGDDSAASRYTEAKLSKISEETMLSDIDKNVVDFRPNFDNTEQEPAILPAQIPNILISGTEGIAVGMASKIPTHNLGEVIDATIATINNPKITTAELLNYIKGPDFATGGIISNANELAEIYENGFGKIKVRGKLHVEEEKGKSSLVITEIPYTMIGAIDRFMDCVADLVRNHTAPDIIDIRNLSSKDGIRIIVDLKKGANVQRNINILYKKAKFEDTFGYNALLLNNGTPRQMCLIHILSEFIAFYHETMVRKYQYLYNKESRQKEIKEGLIKAIDCVDVIIEVLRGSKIVADAKACLMHGDCTNIKFKSKSSERVAQNFSFTECQADAILEMKLQRLIGLELATLTEELKQHTKNANEYNGLLNSKTKMKNKMISNLEVIKNKYAIPRKTDIISADKIIIEKEAIKEELLYVLINRFGYIKAVDSNTYERNKQSIANDYRFCIQALNTDKLLLFTDIAKCHSIKISDIPLGKYNDKGMALEQLSNFTSCENILYVNSCSAAKNNELLFVTRRGIVKRVSGLEFDVSKRTVDSTRIAAGDSLFFVADTQDTSDVVLVSDNNIAIRFKLSDVSIFKKTSIGIRGIRLNEKDKIVVCAVGVPSDTFNIKDTDLAFSYIKLTKRDSKGTKIRI